MWKAPTWFLLYVESLDLVDVEGSYLVVLVDVEGQLCNDLGIRLGLETVPFVGQKLFDILNRIPLNEYKHIAIYFSGKQYLVVCYDAVVYDHKLVGRV